MEAGAISFTGQCKKGKQFMMVCISIYAEGKRTRTRGLVRRGYFWSFLGDWWSLLLSCSEPCLCSVGASEPFTLIRFSLSLVVKRMHFHIIN